MTVVMILLISAAAIYITSLPCRFAVSRRRRAAWYFAVLGAAGAGALTILFVYQGDLFRPSKWDTGKVTMLITVPMIFMISGAIGFIPASLVVRHYRVKFEDDLKMSTMMSDISVLNQMMASECHNATENPTGLDHRQR
jgi:hypothetical protein